MYFDNTEQLRDKLTFVESTEDSYWFCEGLIFELFFSADENGPDEKQLSAYLDFQQESFLYIDAIRKKAIDYIEREKGTAPKRYHSTPPSVDVVNMNDDKSKATMDIVLSFCTFRFLFYTRWKTWVAKFNGRELISLEPSK